MSQAARDGERYVALLKGINVGGHTVKMDRLRDLFEEVEVDGSRLESVESYIASGNIIFSSASRDPRRIEVAVVSRLEAMLGWPVPAFVRPVETICRIAVTQPFPDVDAGSGRPSLYVAFLPSALDAAVSDRVEAASTSTDEFRIEGSELYWLCRTRFSDSPFSGPALERLLGCAVTVRSSNTVRKIAERFRA